jgi:hypothetical protein
MEKIMKNDLRGLYIESICPSCKVPIDTMITPDEVRELVDHPKHYNNLGAKCKCGLDIECIDVVGHMDYTIGNAVKYLWRAEHKGKKLEDLKKAQWYVNHEIKKMEGDIKND